MIRLELGDCLEVLKGVSDNTFTSCITDPPYGIKFSGKKWDYDLPNIDIWKEIYRVPKPGSMLLSFGGSRTFHRLFCRIEDAGFEIRDCLMWIYASGFPKSMNLSKALDKRFGNNRKSVGFKNEHDIRSNNYGGLPKGYFVYEKTEPISEIGSLWDGFGTALKPAYEPIVLAMKPVYKSFVDNALCYEVSGLNIDEARIPLDGEVITINTWDDEAKYFNGISGGDFQSKINTDGRWPANVIHDGSSEVEELFPYCKVGTMKPCRSKNRKLFRDQRDLMPKYKTFSRKGSEGSASRFFYCAKANKKEKKGLKHPTVKPLALMEYLCKLVKMPKSTFILDPFMGSGTTGLACKNLNIDFFGIELDSRYHYMARERLFGKSYFRNCVLRRKK